MKFALLALALTAITAPALGAAAKEETLRVIPARSTVQWTGKKVVEKLGAHTGKVAVKSGNMTIADGKLMAGEVVMDMSSITNEDLKDASDNKKLIGHLKSPDFFDVEKHPTAKLVIDKAEMSKASEYKIAAKLSIKGKTKAVDFVAKETQGKDGKTASVTLVFDRTDFDIRYGSGKFFENLGDKMIADPITLEVKLALEK